jgi:hypothetical protein
MVITTYSKYVSKRLNDKITSHTAAQTKLVTHVYLGYTYFGIQLKS